MSKKNIQLALASSHRNKMSLSNWSDFEFVRFILRCVCVFFFFLNYQIKSSIVYSDGTLFYLRAFESIQSEFHYLFRALDKVHFINDPLLHGIKHLKFCVWHRPSKSTIWWWMWLKKRTKQKEKKNPNSFYASIDRIVQIAWFCIRIWLDILLIHTKLEWERAMFR